MNTDLTAIHPPVVPRHAEAVATEGQGRTRFSNILEESLAFRSLDKKLNHSYVPFYLQSRSIAGRVQPIRDLLFAHHPKTTPSSSGKA